MSSRYYDKEELKSKLEVEQIYDLLEAWGGEPEYTSKGIVSQTICHNLPGEGSRKLYYYDNGDRGIFSCYTNCGTLDIFELCIKVMKIQRGLDWELYDAMDYIANYFGFTGVEKTIEDNSLDDWNIFKRHRVRPAASCPEVQLKEYNPVILSKFLYPRIKSWEDEGISDKIIKRNFIGYYPGGEQITIPHFDIDGRLVGIRGRALGQEEAERYGKYTPLYVNKQLYNHPLSMNLYNLNNSKENIRKTKSAIMFEGEKSALRYQTEYGPENDISVACCGSAISTYQIELLRKLGVRELVIAFDRQFQEIGDDEFKRLKSKLVSFYNKYNNSIHITAIFDKEMILPYKASPIDSTKEVFEKLMSERIVPKMGV